MAALRTDFATSRLLAEAVRESRSPSKPKDLIILAFYLPLGNLSEMKSRERIKEFSEIIKGTTNQIEKDTNYKVYSFVLPTKDNSTKMECIFPKEKDEIVSEFLQEMKEQKLLP